ncbi:MAG: stage II sporulation protein R [Eubacteriales bacterium]|nr:stage II sporulation protein R [Eubacteriales bacterium]
MKKSKLKTWEIAVLLALATVLLWGAWTAHSQDALARKMIRLHVIANSDSEQDQVLKLQVRDIILDQATAILEEADNMAQAVQKLEQSLPDMESIAAKEINDRGYHYPVTARLEETEFPTKEYDGFRLPSGEYLALRIVIGEGAGKNWWCVVFPPLCTTAATDLGETAMAAGWNEKDVSFITEEDEGYVLKFRAVELWENLRQRLGK